MRDQDLRAVTEVLAAGGRVLVLSDFDGTLAPIAPDPAAVRLAPAMRRLLATLAASSRARTHIKRYRDLQTEVEETLDEVNRAVGTRSWRPIVYIERHHERRDIWPFYRHADFCMVTALHDGMNLVAKEFVSVRDDDNGVLILSRFTGAARELRDALLVNPYDLDETAEAIRAAIEMPAEERSLRMARMRQVVREHRSCASTTSTAGPGSS